MHFGNGDEDDQTWVRGFFPLASVTVFPGIAYAFLQFKNEGDRDETLSKCTSVDPAFYIEIEEWPIFLLWTNLNVAELSAY